MSSLTATSTELANPNRKLILRLFLVLNETNISFFTGWREGMEWNREWCIILIVNVVSLNFRTKTSCSPLISPPHSIVYAFVPRLGRVSSCEMCPVSVQLRFPLKNSRQSRAARDREEEGGSHVRHDLVAFPELLLRHHQGNSAANAQRGFVRVQLPRTASRHTAWGP
jgi:hypothetical protein